MLGHPLERGINCTKNYHFAEHSDKFSVPFKDLQQNEMADLLIKQEEVNKDFGIKPTQWCIDFKIDSISNLIKTEWTSESDPYVYVTLEGEEGKQNLRTAYMKNQENPVFDRYSWITSLVM